MQKSPHSYKEIQLRKRLYSRLAYCLRVELKYLAIGSKWAAYYQQEAKRIRLKLKGDLRKKVYPPLVHCFVFYPEGETWRKYELWTSNPEALGNRSAGARQMMNSLLRKKLPVVTTPKTTQPQIAGVSITQTWSQC
jgi:hypothetical protein